MIMPLFFETIGGIAALQQLKTPLTFTETSLSHCSSVMSVSSPAYIIPALLTRRSTLPILSNMALTCMGSETSAQKASVPSSAASECACSSDL